MVDRAEMIAPNRGFSRTADPMQPYKSVPGRPLLLWQRTSTDYIDIRGVYEDMLIKHRCCATQCRVMCVIYTCVTCKRNTIRNVSELKLRRSLTAGWVKSTADALSVRRQLTFLLQRISMRKHASAVLAIVILSVCPSAVCPKHAGAVFRRGNL